MNFKRIYFFFMKTLYRTLYVYRNIKISPTIYSLEKRKFFCERNKTNSNALPKYLTCLENQIKDRDRSKKARLVSNIVEVEPKQEAVRKLTTLMTSAGFVHTREYIVRSSSVEAFDWSDDDDLPASHPR